MILVERIDKAIALAIATILGDKIPNEDIEHISMIARGAMLATLDIEGFQVLSKEPEMHQYDAMRMTYEAGYLMDDVYRSAIAVATKIEEEP